MQEITWKYGSPLSDEVVREVESELQVVFPPTIEVWSKNITAVVPNRTRSGFQIIAKQS